MYSKSILFLHFIYLETVVLFWLWDILSSTKNGGFWRGKGDSAGKQTLSCGFKVQFQLCGSQKWIYLATPHSVPRCCVLKPRKLLAPAQFFVPRAQGPFELVCSEVGQCCPLSPAPKAGGPAWWQHLGHAVGSFPGTLRPWHCRHWWDGEQPVLGQFVPLAFVKNGNHYEFSQRPNTEHLSGCLWG